MFSFSESVEINAPVERVYEILVDFKNYRKFASELKKIKIVSQTKTHAEVQFTISSILTAHYTLDYKFEENTSIRWKLIEGDFIKKYGGSWKLTSIGENKTIAEINVKIDFSFFVPSSIVESQLEERSPKKARSSSLSLTLKYIPLLQQNGCIGKKPEKNNIYSIKRNPALFVSLFNAQ
jgi:coenzyme Q-binding protein COQ10